MLIAIVCLGVFWLLLNIIAVVWTHWKGNKYRAAWVEGTIHKFAEFEGTYKITMYPRWLWWWFKNIKIFFCDYYVTSEDTQMATRGLNILFGIIAWGKKIVVELKPSGKLLDYSPCCFPWCIIRDYVKRKKGETDSYICRFCIKLPVIGEKQLSWFTMEKMQ